MKIHSLYYKNLLQGWELEEVHFSDLNVLVGISGAGKPSVSKYHFMYLTEMLKPTKRYSKTNVNNVSDLLYFEEIIKRVGENTTHLNSFQVFISFFEKINRQFYA